MTRPIFLRIVAVILFSLNGLTALSIDYQLINDFSYDHNNIRSYDPEYKTWSFPNTWLRKKYGRFTNENAVKWFLFFKNARGNIAVPTKKKGEKELEIVYYQSDKEIIFHAKKNILSLRGTSTLTYDTMKLEADIIALNLNEHTIDAEGTKDQHGKAIGNPMFTYKDVQKDKYGKEGTTTTRTFFMEKIRYNIDTKRALVHKLLTKQEESVIKSEQIKKEDEETFYAKDLIYTTCGLAQPHFYIKTKRAKMVQDKQITSGPFRFYFDGVPTPLGFIFGTLFLEGKRTHGIIPPEIGEETTHGFYLRNGGYYFNFDDYVDFSILGSIYSNGTAELKNELRYKKRYSFSGDISYDYNIDKGKGEEDNIWSLKWTHKTLGYGIRSLNAHIALRNKSHKTTDTDDEYTKTQHKGENKSSGSLSYQDKLVGLPYELAVKAKYDKNLKSNFAHWTLPEGTLTGSWHPFKREHTGGTQRWFQKIHLKHTIRFENQFQNSKEDPDSSSIFSSKKDIIQIPSDTKWNIYTENGILHTIPVSLDCKLFEYFSFIPNFTYSEAWYWKKLSFKQGEDPIHVPGFNRVYSWSFGGSLQTNLFYTRYFSEEQLIQGFRIKMEPNTTFTYTPDFSKKAYGFFQEVTNNENKIENKYLFENFSPTKNLPDRATAELKLQLKNTVELKVKRERKEDTEKKKKKSHKVFLLKNLDFETTYDFKAKEFHLTDGIDIKIASEAKIWKLGKATFDLTTKFDPYLSAPLIPSEDKKIKEKPINEFSWNHGQYLGKVKKAQFKLSMDFQSTHNSKDKKEKKKALLNDSSGNGLKNKIGEKEHKIDFETPWSCGWEFNWIYNRLYEYNVGELNYTKQKYITFNGSITLVKKWKLSARSTYNFDTNKLDPYATEISIQRDLHCWQLSYQWHPLASPAKYDFSLGIKANALKALKLPRKRSYNKVK